MHLDPQRKGMNMAISVRTEEKLFPPAIDGVRILFFNKIGRVIRIPAEGPVVTVQLNTGTLTDGEVGGLVGEARFYDIIAYDDGEEYYSTHLRMTRWSSSKMRWFIYYRLAAKIRRAVKFVR